MINVNTLASTNFSCCVSTYKLFLLFCRWELVFFTTHIALLGSSFRLASFPNCMIETKSSVWFMYKCIVRNFQGT